MSLQFMLKDFSKSSKARSCLIIAILFVYLLVIQFFKNTDFLYSAAVHVIKTLHFLRHAYQSYTAALLF